MGGSFIMTIFPSQKTPLALGASSWITAKIGVTAPSNLVSRVENLANPNNPYTQGTTANQPTLTTLRGLPVIAFQGSPQKSLLSLSSPSNGSRTFTCYTASMMSANVITNDVFIASAGLLLKRYETIPQGGVCSFINAGGGYEPRLTIAAQSNSIPNISVTSYNDSTGNHSLAVNNGTPITQTRSPSSANLTAMSISNPSTNSSILYIHEQIWFPRLLTAAEDLEIERWLSNQWGIQIS